MPPSATLNNPHQPTTLHGPDWLNNPSSSRATLENSRTSQVGLGFSGLMVDMALEGGSRVFAAVGALDSSLQDLYEITFECRHAHLSLAPLPRLPRLRSPAGISSRRTVH